MPEHYQQPGWLSATVFNPMVGLVTRLGLSLFGSRVLEVKGRKSGEWRSMPVNPLRFEGGDYLVSPRRRSPLSSPAARGVGADAPEDELRRIAPDHPIFRITLA